MRSRHPVIAGVAALIVVSACAGRVRAPTADESVRDEIVSMLGRAAMDWNAGDLDAFMSDYLPGRRATFVTPRGILRGPEEIRAAYAPRFAPGAVRDSLSFEGVEVDVLAPGVAHVIAWYVLSRGDSVTARGLTSLIMERDAERWRIVHDHSS